MKGQLLTDKHTINKKVDIRTGGKTVRQRDSQDPHANIGKCRIRRKNQREPICMNQPMVINGKEKSGS